MAGNSHSKPEPKYQQDNEAERQEDRWFLWQIAQRTMRYATQMFTQTQDNAGSSDTAPTTSIPHSKHDKCNLESSNPNTDTESVATSESSEYLSAYESLDVEDTSCERGTCETHHSSQRDTSESTPNVPNKESTAPVTLEHANTHTCAVNKQQRKSVSSIKDSTTCSESPTASCSEHSSKREKGEVNDSITRTEEKPPLQPHQASQISAHQSSSFASANATHPSAEISATAKTIMNQSDIKILLEALANHADKWDMIGCALGFTPSELDVIRAKPTLHHGAPNSWLTEMLSRWVQWTPDTQHGKYATLHDLVNALRSDAVKLAIVAKRIWIAFKGEQNDLLLGQPQQESSAAVTSDQDLLDSESWQSESKTLAAAKVPEAYEIIPPSPSASPFECYVFYLRSLFTRKTEPAVKWPGIGGDTRKYIHLAVIDNQYLQHKAYQKFIEATVHGSIDDIVEGKAPIQMSDLFKPNFINKKEFVLMKQLLVEGAPGIGKSTMSLEICRKWGSGELFQEFSLVVMLRFRDPWVQQVKRVSDLFRYPDEPEMQQEVARHIKRIQGSGVLLILEGYDEAPPSLRETDSLFFQLFTGDLLPNATVMVTTRPSASSELRRWCKGESSRRIEVIGFGKKEIDDYIESHYRERGKESNNFYKYLELYPHIHSMMYVPLNSDIVTRVYDSCKTNSTLVPQTMTQLYTALVKNVLLGYMEKFPEYKGIQINDFSDLPQPVLEKFHQVCKLAFQGITSAQTKVIFSDLPKDFDTLGLMQSVTELYIDKGTSVSHNFLHLTIQEYLAAYHLSLLSEEVQVKFLKENMKERATVSQFLAGLSHQNVSAVCKALSLFQTCTDAAKVPVSTLHMLFELHNPLAITSVLGSQAVFPRRHLRIPFDWYVYGYCISHCSSLKASFNSSIDDENVKMFTNGISAFRHQMDQSAEPNLGVTHLYLGCGSTKGCSQLEKFIPEFSNLHFLDVTIRGIGNGGAVELIKHLPNSTTIKLSKTCIGEKDCEALRDVLASPNHCIEYLDISDNNLTPVAVQHIIDGLTQNPTIIEGFQHQGAVVLPESSSTLQSLNLSRCHVGDNGATALAEALERNSTLLSLNLSYCYVGDKGATALAKALERNSTLQSLDLTFNSIRDGAAVHAALATALESNSTLQSLNLSHVGDKGATALAKALESNSKLLSFNLSSCYVGDKGATALAQALERNSTLQSLDLTFNSIRDGAAVHVALATALESNSTLQSLNLSHCHVGDSGVEALGKALERNSTIQSLNLLGNRISNEGATVLAKALERNSTLRSLNLLGNSISNAGAATLARALKRNSTLHSLNLSCNCVSDKGTAAIAKALENNVTLRSLVLSSNNSGDEGATALAETLERNSTLHSLNLLRNCVSDEGTAAIAKALENNVTLQSLNLASNSTSTLGFKGVTALAKALERNSTLKSLDLSDNYNISDEGATELAKALKSNSTLQSLNLTCNCISVKGAKALAKAMETNLTCTVRV